MRTFSCAWRQNRFHRVNPNLIAHNGARIVGISHNKSARALDGHVPSGGAVTERPAVAHRITANAEDRIGNTQSHSRIDLDGMIAGLLIPKQNRPYVHIGIHNDVDRSQELGGD